MLAGLGRLRQAVLLNGHLGNTGVLWNAVDQLVASLSPRVSISGRSWWDLSDALWEEVTSDAPSARSQFHANWAETALMLHLRPDLVRMDRATDQEEHPWEFSYDMGRKSASGAVGRRITKATAEDGRQLFDHAAGVLTDVLRRMLEEEPPAAPSNPDPWNAAAVRRITGDDTAPPRRRR